MTNLVGEIDPNDITKILNGDSVIPRLVVCAANRVGGEIVLGIRHWCPKMCDTVDKLGVQNDHRNREDQGFIDQTGRYLTRTEAMQCVRENGQKLNGQLPLGNYTQLFSEHLY